MYYFVIYIENLALVAQLPFQRKPGKFLIVPVIVDQKL